MIDHTKRGLGRLFDSHATPLIIVCALIWILAGCSNREAATTAHDIDQAGQATAQTAATSAAAADQVADALDQGQVDPAAAAAAMRQLSTHLRETGIAIGQGLQVLAGSLVRRLDPKAEYGPSILAQHWIEQPQVALASAGRQAQSTDGETEDNATWRELPWTLLGEGLALLGLGGAATWLQRKRKQTQRALEQTDQALTQAITYGRTAGKIARSFGANDLVDTIQERAEGIAGYLGVDDLIKRRLHEVKGQRLMIDIDPDTVKTVSSERV